MNKKTLLHRLRNSYGVNEIEMRDARLQAADELERLYVMEEKVKDILEKIISCETKIISVDATCPECSIYPCACELHG